MFCRISMKGGKPRGIPTVLPSPAHKKWHKQQMEDFAKQGIKQEQIAKVKSVHLTCYHKMNKNGSFPKSTFDLTNKAESVMDLLVDYGFILDDDYNTIPDIRLTFGGFRNEAGADLSMTW